MERHDANRRETLITPPCLFEHVRYGMDCSIIRTCLNDLETKTAFLVSTR